MVLVYFLYTRRKFEMSLEPKANGSVVPRKHALTTTLPSGRLLLGVRIRQQMKICVELEVRQKEMTIIKTYRYLYFLIVLGILCYGCAEKEEQSEPEEVETEVQASDADNQETIVASIQPGMGVGKVKFGMTVDELTSALGKPDIDATGISYVYADLGIEVVIRDDKVHSVYCVHHIPNASEVKTCEYQTEKGIGIGSTESDIIAAYGEPTKRSKGALMYKELGLRFELENGQVQKIIALKPL